MLRLAALCLFLCLLTPPAIAHVGSPNVFFEGRAGSHAVRVSIRPPPSIPGPAQIDIHAEGAVSQVSVRSVFWDAGEGAAPPAVDAGPVAGSPGLYHTALWILRKGAYSIQVKVDDSAGSGIAVVPLDATSNQPPSMPLGLAITLCALGVLLVAGALWITRSASPPGSRMPTVIVALLLAAALVAGGWRWREMDRAFRENALDQPRPVTASIFTEGTLRLLRLTPPAENRAPGWESLLADHGKLMHLFLLREPDQEVFAHLHPVRRDARTFENVLPPLPAGDYQVYGEITLANGLSRTLVASLAVPAPIGPALPPQADAAMVNELWCRAPAAPLGNAGQPYALDADDSWFFGAPASAAPGSATQLAPLPEGGHLVFLNAGALAVNRETSLRFTAIDSAGRALPLQHYIGMPGHAVVRRADGAVFIHLHPAGTFSMGAQELFAGAGPAAQPTELPREVGFPYAFQRAGQYRIWVQVRIAGRIQTGVFQVTVL